jgi:hypothetical protein
VESGMLEITNEQVSNSKDSRYLDLLKRLGLD